MHHDSALSIWFHKNTLWLGAALIMFTNSAYAMDLVIMERRSSSIDSRKDYTEHLLREILNRTTEKFGPYELQYSATPMEHRQRILLEMKRGELINIAVQATQPDWERELPVIRIPIDKGIASYRIFLIDQKKQAAFSAITDVKRLKEMRLGVGRSWTSQSIYAANGFNVVTGNSYEDLFWMVSEKRFDFFPRAIYEAIPEQLTRKQKIPGLVVEKSLALYFPLPRYFFVSPRFPHLSQRIEAGLEMLLKDGSFDRLFMEYHGDLIKQTDLCSRRIFNLVNPDLNAKTPLQRKELWFSCPKPSSNAHPAESHES